MKKIVLALSTLCLFPFSGILFADNEAQLLATSISLGQKATTAMAESEFSSVFAMFDKAMQQALPQEKLKTTWQAIIAQVGPYKKYIDSRTETKKPYVIVYSLVSFEKASLTIKYVFTTQGNIAGLWFQPESVFHEADYTEPDYVNKDSFSERKTIVGQGRWKLPGTLTLPKTHGPVPAVVLVHGSGPNDRDETLGPNKPFRDLAWGLASRDIAVLRYDKRTLTYGKRLAAESKHLTVKEETIDDALSAVQLLKGVKEIDATKIVLLGHSLGGMLAPRIAAGNSDIAGIIIMAGAARPLEDIIIEQVAYIAFLDNSVSEKERQILQQLKKQVSAVKDPKLSPDTPASDLPLGLAASYWLDLSQHPVSEYAARLKQPVLVLQGKRDYQVTTQDFTLWKKLFSRQQTAVFKLYPDLNHLFMTGHGVSSPAEYSQKGNVHATVITDIVSWVKNNFTE